MKFRIIILLTFAMPLFSCSQENSKLSKVLTNWIKNPEKDLSDELRSKAKDTEVKTLSEAKLIVSGLELINKQLQSSLNKKTEDNLYSLTSLFQEATTKESAKYLDEYGIKLLAEVLDAINSKKNNAESRGNSEMMILKMFAMYKNELGLKKLSELINLNFKPEEYLWSIIMSQLAEDEKKYSLIIERLAGKIPIDFLGITYLDMCNSISIKSDKFKHPFNNLAGYRCLDSIIKNSGEEHESYIVSAAASIPFLSDSFQNSLLESTSRSKSIDVQLEAAWAGAKSGKEKYKQNLIAFARDYRYSSKAKEYLMELKLENSIPKEINNPDFIALSEMCGWLAHPNEYGSYPDKAEIYDKRELFWPPTKDKRILYIIKYEYKAHNEDGSNEIGVGLVGSVTFSLFGLEDLYKKKPLDIYAIHCSWELEKENYEDVKAGINLLKKYNKNLE